VDGLFNVTLNKVNQLQVIVRDNDITDVTTLNINFTRQSDGTDLSSQLTYTGNIITIISWTPTSIDPVTLE
jgi:hypothetical protein